MVMYIFSPHSFSVKQHLQCLFVAQRGVGVVVQPEVKSAGYRS